jgi:predicted nucleic acid-binding protein
MISIDTGILIWGIREHAQAGREDMIERSKSLIRDHQDRRIPIMVPSIVLAEYLATFDAKSQEEQRDIIGRNFFVAPFDNKAAWIAGELYDKARIKSIQQGGTPKQCVHADLKIIATSIAHSATHLFTDNLQDFTTLAGGKIIVKPIPELPPPPPPSLFPQ